jgi:acetyltransferase-like isoleucine patch superfamily enzyme
MWGTRRVGAWLEHPINRVMLRGRFVEPYRRRRFHSFGGGSVLHRPDWIYGPQQMAIGERVLALHGLWLAVERPAWDLPAPVLTIGDRTAIRPYCTISVAESVSIEDDVVIAAFSTVIDSDHTIGPNPSVLDNPLVTAPVRIGRGCWIGERVAVLRDSTIGEFSVIGANSVVNGEIPPFSVAVGSPARVVGSTRDVEPMQLALQR